MNNLKVIEKNDVRVLTSAQLAEVFGTDFAKIRYNFNYNKNRYEEGKHFYLIKGEDLKDFKTKFEIHTELKHAHTIYLWTEKGAFLHAKSLNTDKAWDAYTLLIDDYFAKVEQVQRANIPTTIPNTIEDILELAVVNMKDLRNEINQVRKENQQLKLVVDNQIYLTDTQCAEVQEAVRKRIGRLMKNGYEAHFQSIFTALKTHFTVPKYNKIARKDFESAIDFINGWYPRKKDEQNA